MFKLKHSYEFDMAKLLDPFAYLNGQILLQQHSTPSRVFE